jgi:hypothetical protein
MDRGQWVAAGAAFVVIAGAAFIAIQPRNPAPQGAPAAATEGATQTAASSGPVPDFSSAGMGWRQANSNGDNTGFEPVPGDTGPGFPSHHPDWPYKQNVVNRVGDFTNPNLTPWAAGVLEQRARKVMAGGIPFIPNSRCWPGGVPGLHFFPAPIYFLQTPKEVWLLSNRGEVRRIYLDVPHSQDPGTSWYGESIGHYENGDTLVVDTIGMDDRGPIDRYNTPHTKQLHVVERFIMSPDRKNLTAVMTVEDPGAFKQPFKGQMHYEPATERGGGEPSQWEEYVCNENSQEFFIPEDQLVPVPSAAKRDF